MEKVGIKILNRGVKKSEGSTIIFSLGMIFAFSMVMVGLVSWINVRHEKIKREYADFYGQDYVVQYGDVKFETN